jgi:colanic acid biosynthesis glycosyl transferase WcaI
MPDDGDAFRQAIESLAAEESTRVRLGQAARQYAVENLSQEAILGQFMRDLGEVSRQLAVGSWQLAVGSGQRAAGCSRIRQEFGRLKADS